MMNNYLKTILTYAITLIPYLFFISLLYYFEICNFKIIRIINYIYNIIMFFICGFKIAHLEKKKGFLKGFIIGVILIIIFSILSLIFSNFTFNTLVYYLSLICISITGGIIGVSNKKEC